MQHKVLLETTPVVKGLRTLGTLVRKIPSVLAKVPSQTAVFFKCHRAAGALERPLARVDHDVHPQGVGIPKCLWAVTALVRPFPFPSVPAGVPFQGVLIPI